MKRLFRRRRSKSHSANALNYDQKDKQLNSNVATPVEKGIDSAKSDDCHKHNHECDREHESRGSINTSQNLVESKRHTNHRAIVAELDKHQIASPSHISLLNQLEEDTIPIAYLIRALSKTKAHLILLRLATLYPDIIEKEIRSANENSSQIGSDQTLVQPLTFDAEITSNDEQQIDKTGPQQQSPDEQLLNQLNHDHMHDNEQHSQRSQRSSSSRRKSKGRSHSMLCVRDDARESTTSSSVVKDLSQMDKYRLFKEEMNRIANRLGYQSLEELKRASKLYQVFGDSVPQRELSLLRRRSQSLKVDLQLEKWKDEQSGKAEKTASKVQRVFALKTIVDDGDIDSLAQAPNRARRHL